jgi:(E)-4-hydroxy-3-methylbut-2-enyl-diphosphate synthase
MSVRPFRDIKRRKTKVINVGDVKIGGDNPISVQSMTNTLTTDVKATINQINDIVKKVLILSEFHVQIKILLLHLKK